MERLVLLQMERPLTQDEERWLGSFVAPEKTRQLSRIAHRETRQQRLLADGLIRWMAGEYLRVPPSSLRFSTAPGGKPVLAGHPRVHYNLSHTQGSVLCGLSDRPVGVDIEHIRPLHDRVAAIWFTPAEQAWAGDDPLRRIILWTKKEAAAKWNGEGLPARRQTNVLEEPWASRIISRQTDAWLWSVCCEPAWLSPPIRLTLQEFINRLHAASRPCACSMEGTVL